MPLRRSQLSTSTLFDIFWKKKIQNIIVPYPSNEKHWPLNPEYLKKQIRDFAEKDPGSMTVTERYAAIGEQVLKKIILTIAPDGTKSERFTLVVEPRNGAATFYATCQADGCISETSVYRFNSNVKLTLRNIDSFIKRFAENHEEAQNLRFAREKENKLLDIAENSIETIIPRIMSSSGHDWHLSCEETRYVLSIKMKKRKMVQISLTPNNFAEKIPEILKVVTQIENLLEQIPYPVDIKTYGINTQWEKG
jgi:hypothetical protein